MTEMIKVLIITSNTQPVPAVNGGATEKLIEILIKHNEEFRKMNLSVISVHNKIAEKISNQYTHTDIIYYHKFKSIKNFIKYPIFNLMYILKSIMRSISMNRYSYFILKHTEKNEYDVVVVEGGRYENFACLNTRGRRFALIAHVHRNIGHLDLGLLAFDKVIAVSHHIKENIANKLLIHNISVLHNCCDDKSFHKKSVSCRVKTDSPFIKRTYVILYVGRVIEEKGVYELLQSVALTKMTNVRVRIAGEVFYKHSGTSDYEDKLRKHELYLQGKVDFLGFIDNGNLSEIMTECDLCVVPSQYPEPLSLVPLEAMYAGLPVILSNAGGLREWCVDGYPEKIDLGDNFLPELARKISEYLTNPEKLEQAKEKGKRISELHTSEQYYENFVRLITQ